MFDSNSPLYGIDLMSKEELSEEINNLKAKEQYILEELRLCRCWLRSLKKCYDKRFNEI